MFRHCPPRARRASFVPGIVAMAFTGALAVACGASRGAELEPRYVAVHNTLAAMGMVEIGPLQRGSLAEGAEARRTIDLVPQCVTLVVVGGDGARDVDLTLLDPAGKPLAHDTTHEPEAA